MFPTGPSVALRSPREHQSPFANPSNQHALGQLSHSVSPGYPVGFVSRRQHLCQLPLMNKDDQTVPSAIPISECISQTSACGTRLRDQNMICGIIIHGPCPRQVKCDNGSRKPQESSAAPCRHHALGTTRILFWLTSGASELQRQFYVP